MALVQSIFTNWVESTLPSSGNWLASTYGEGKFVAFRSNSNNAAYSYNGIDWTLITLPISAGWSSIGYGEGIFIAISNNNFSTQNKAVYSYNGIDWTLITLPSASINGYLDIAYGEGKFIAITGAFEASYSNDGINWTQFQLLPAYNPVYWTSITYGNGVFVIIGTNVSNQAGYSNDGINWNPTTLPFIGSWSSVAYGNGTFIAIARETNKGAYSNNGITWTEFTLPLYSNWEHIVYGQGRFFAFSMNAFASGIIDNSGNIIWNYAGYLPIQDFGSATYGDDKIILTARDGNKSYYNILSN